MKLKKITIVIILMSVAYCSHSQQQEINFFAKKNWSQVLQQAKDANKMIFVDCYATWCRPCKLMDSKIYTVSTVAEFYNKHFINVKFQMDTSFTDNDEVKSTYSSAQNIKKRYHITAYPTFLFFNTDGEIVHRGVGYHDTTSMLKLGQDACNPEEQYYTLLRRFQANELFNLKDYERLTTMAIFVNDDSIAHTVANKYIDALSISQLLTKTNIAFMYKYTTTSKDRGFDLFRDSSETINKVDSRMTRQVCDWLVIQIIYAEEIKPFEKSANGKPDWQKIQINLKKYGALGDQTINNYKSKIVFQSVIEPALNEDPTWDKILELVRKQTLGENEKYLVSQVIRYYEIELQKRLTSNCRNFILAARYYTEHYPDIAKAPQQNEFAWVLFKYDTIEGDLEIAMEWAKYALETVRDSDRLKAAYIDTYSNLLYKLGRKQEAIEWEQRAASTNNNPKDLSFSNTLEKMKKGEITW